MFKNIDHIVLAVPNLSEGINYLENLTGATCSPGGKHPQFGTHNALLKIGKEMYLEILAPDPDNRQQENLWMGLSHIQEPRISRLALKSANIEAEAQLLAQHAVGHGQLQEGKRLRPNGTLLQWQLTRPLADPMIDGIPFLIDWGKSLHPAQGMNEQCTLKSISIAGPDTLRLTAIYNQLKVDLSVDYSVENNIVVSLETPKGIIILE